MTRRPGAETGAYPVPVQVDRTAALPASGFPAPGFPASSGVLASGWDAA